MGEPCQELRMCSDGKYRTWVKVSCTHCGKEFWRDRRWVYKNVFCSRDCQYKYKQKRIDVTCANCGKKVKRIATHYNNSKTKLFFCDIKCKYEAQHIKNIFRKTKIIRCYKCDKSIEVDYRASKKICETCNPHRVRRKIDWSKVLSGEVVAKYHNSLRKYLLDNHIKENKCETCGISTWLTKKIKIQVHHIDGNKYNNVIDNLTMACPNCHTQTDTYGHLNRKKVIT